MNAQLFFAKSISFALINRLLLHVNGVKEYGDPVTIGFCTMIKQEEIAKENAIAPTPAFINKLSLKKIIILTLLNLELAELFVSSDKCNY